MDFNKIFRERDPTQGSIIKNILAMTWPLWFNSGVFIVFWSLNIYWISKLGSQALAALAAGNISFMLMMTPIQGLVAVGYGLIGNLAGQGDKEELEKVTKEIVATCWLLSLIIAFGGYLIAPLLLKLVGVETEVHSLAVTYLRIQVVGGIISFSVWVINGIIRAARDMARPMLIVFSVIAFNALFDPFFILGWLGFPKLGIAGAALSSAASAALGSIIGFWMLIKGKTPLKIKLKGWRDFKIRLNTLKEIVKIAGCDALDAAGKVTIHLILLGFVALWGTAALAAYSIGYRFQRMSSIIGFDLATTTAIIMSNNLGAGNIKRAEANTWISVGFNAFIMAGAGLILFLFADKIAILFSQDPQVIRIAIQFLKITTPVYIFLAAGIILQRAFTGAKDTRTPMAINFSTWGGIQLFLAWQLPKFFNLEAAGIWWAIATAMIFNGLIFAILFKLGFWKPKK